MIPHTIHSFDTHCHINFPEYDSDRKDVIERARSAGVGAFIVGTHEQTSLEAVDLAHKYEHLWAIVGIHPITVTERVLENHVVCDWRVLESLVQKSRVIGIGECGFDFYRNISSMSDFNRIYNEQKQAFEHQMNLAHTYQKPVMLHIRNSNLAEIPNAYDEALTIIRNFPHVKGNVHFYAGTVEQAQAFIDAGYTISFTGVITFAPMYTKLIQSIPLEKIMSETDAPYVAPIPWRGERNEPSHVIRVIEAIADIKGIPLEEVKKTLYRSTVEHYKLT